MKKKTSKKELEVKIEQVEKKMDSYNALFALYVKYKNESEPFQNFLKEELGKKNGIVL
tara:strand:+ start:368 stop:541 length:174 start_codon:yes stop_codon:yes gene_type:complete